MTRVVRLLTLAELDEGGTGDLSVSAQSDAVLDDRRRIVLLADRGWTETTLIAARGEEPPPEPPPPMREDIEETAREVVGPDEPFGGATREEAEASHWRTLAGTLAEHGIEADPNALARLPHDVELGERLRARLERDG